MKVEFCLIGRGEFEKLAALAKRLWHAAFDNLITSAQVEYMLSRFQCEDAFIRQTQSEGYEYYYIKACGEIAGYVAIAGRGDKLFLSKLYLSPEYQGKGIARQALDFVKNTAEERKLTSVYLTVNKGNAHAIAVYEKCGFKKIAAEKTDIGGGFVMDDYILST